MRVARRHAIAWALGALALILRLPLLSISLEEVDTANFVNALKYGYDIPMLRPHPPGYPVYVALAKALNVVAGDPLRALTLLSAILGALAVVPFYLLATEFVNVRFAVVGSLLFLLNPLVWSFSEAGLSDVPGMFFVLVLAFLCYRATRSDGALLVASVVASLAIGVRQSNLCFLPLLLFPLAYRRGALGHGILRPAISSATLFAMTSAVWVLIMILAGSGGYSDYAAAVNKQWSTAVRVYDLWHVEAPWMVNVILRVERFFYAYFLTFAWTADDAKTAGTLLLIAPWLVGFALFIVTFRVSSPAHMFLTLWLATSVYPILSIHFLARYGLAHLPAFLLACIVGVHSFASQWTTLRHRFEVAVGTIAACTMVLYGIKYQPPVSTFEFTPPAGSVWGGLAIATGVATIIALKIAFPLRDDSQPRAAAHPPALVPAAAVAILILAVAAHGYSMASRAHRQASPSQQMVEFVGARYDARRITPCWDNVTHSTFEALLPGVVPTGYWSVQDLYSAAAHGQTIVATDKCVWLPTLQAKLRLTETSRFEGYSPLFAKAPSIRLYVAGVAR